MPDTFTVVLTLTVYVLTVARLTRIVTTDKIGEPLRLAVAEKLGADSLVTFGAYCTWCVSWWVALVFAFPAAVVAGLPWWFGFGLWPAASYVVGLLAHLD
ncbi:hypothetical protein [Nocardia cyriacigeorgica]|uniref:hypothetical protein n=1 Tax=Nocardia cyriacigeorgica TaxID=135487 RepID=UPI002453B7CF|nr:hypothetical protein [Nocardia cyriacigeorgica]